MLFLSEFGPGNGERRFDGDGAAEAHALERPFDVPAGAGEAIEKLAVAMDGVEQQRPLLGPDDGVDQRQRPLGNDTSN